MKSLPKGDSVQRWNKIFVLCCCIAVAVDPLFLYIPVVIPGRSCLSVDGKIEVAASVLRSLVDIVYAFRIFLQFRTPRGYRCSYFLLDVLSILPLPQVGVRYIAEGPASNVAKELYKAAIIMQFAPRIWRMYPLFKDVTAVSGIFTEMAWAGTAANFCLYILSSHVTRLL